MTAAIPHKVTRTQARRHLLGHLYAGTCICGTTWPPTPDRDAREAAIRKHMEQVKRIELKAADMERRRVAALDERRRARARKEAS